MLDYATRLTIRQEVATAFNDGLTSVTTGAGATTTIADTSRGEVTNYWVGAEALNIEPAHADIGLSRRVTASTQNVSLTVSAFPNPTGNGTDYELFFNFSVAQYHNAIQYAVRRATGNHWIDWMWDGLVIVANTYDYELPTGVGVDEQVITADAGSTTVLLRDAALTQANDYWNGARVVGLTGTAANRGITRYASDFLAATDDLSFAVAWPATIAAADTFQLTRFRPNYVHFVEYIPTGGTIAIGLSDRNWEVYWRAGRPMIRFFAGAVPPLNSTVRIYGVRVPEPPTHDMHPVEVPQNYAIDLARWQILRSKPRRSDYQLDDVAALKREAYDAAMLSLSGERRQRPQGGKKL